MSWKMVEYYCEPCDLRMESLQPRNAIEEAVACESCDGVAGYVISAPLGRTPVFSVVRGKVEEPPKHIQNTEEMYSRGTTLQEFRAKRRKQFADERYKAVKADL